MHRSTTDTTGSLVGHAQQVETERMIQRGRVAALLLSAGLAVSFGSDRSLGVTLAVVGLAGCVAGVQLALRAPRTPTTISLVGWGSFVADAVVCGVALSAVADDPVDPVVMVTLMVAIEGAARWGARGAAGAGLVAGAMAVAWAASGYAAIGRVLPATSVAFRLLAPVVIALPVGLLIERLRLQRDHTRRLFEHANDAMLVLADTRVVAANPAAATLAGTSVEQVIGESFTDRFGPLLQVADLDGLLAAPATAREPVPVTDDHGRQRWFAVEADAPHDAGLVFITARDVTQERVREQELQFRALHDPLTGLPNRAALRSRLVGQLDEPDSLGVVFLDLDGFKQVNDAHGHTAGDGLLVELADRLRQVTRDADTVHRWAGDEFCLVVHGADPPVLEAMADRIAQALRHPFRVGDQPVLLAASVGTAMARPGDTEESLIARADQQMYRRKGPRLRRAT